jgi:hypothetical protein
MVTHHLSAACERAKGVRLDATQKGVNSSPEKEKAPDPGRIGALGGGDYQPLRSTAKVPSDAHWTGAAVSVGTSNCTSCITTG